MKHSRRRPALEPCRRRTRDSNGRADATDEERTGDGKPVRAAGRAVVSLPPRPPRASTRAWRSQVLGLVLAVAFPACAPPPAQLLITNASLFDPRSGEVRSGAAVVVRDGVMIAERAARRVGKLQEHSPQAAPSYERARSEILPRFTGRPMLGSADCRKTLTRSGGAELSMTLPGIVCVDSAARRCSAILVRPPLSA